MSVTQTDMFTSEDFGPSATRVIHFVKFNCPVFIYSSIYCETPNPRFTPRDFFHDFEAHRSASSPSSGFRADIFATRVV